MGKSLTDYLQGRPAQEIAEDDEDRQEMKVQDMNLNERRQIAEKVEELKGIIMEHIEKGVQPQHILYVALRALGLASYDTGWSDKAQKSLEGTYDDVDVLARYLGTATAEAKMLREMERSYYRKLRKQIEARLKEYSKIDKALRESLTVLDALEGMDDIQQAMIALKAQKPQP